MITGHGDDAYRYCGRVTRNFSSNIFTHADLAPLCGFLASRLGDVATYPEPEPRSLEQKIAEHEGISPDCVTVTGGVTEAIYLAALAFRHLTPVICTPTFSEYESASLIHALHEPQFTDSLQPTDTKNVLYWLCNPNNPTGEVIGKDVIDSLAGRDGDVVVVDQAYEDYTTEQLLTDREAIGMGNVLLLHSLTKRYCIPGLRIGYAVGSQPLISRMKSVRQPWTVNALALAAADGFLLNKQPFADAKALCAEAQWLNSQLNGIDGVTALPTQTNFMLCRLQNTTALRLKEWLVDRHGILIRDASNFRGLDGRYFRVAAQNRNDNEALVAAIKEFLALL